MNKSITISLSGLHFNIEEQAYKNLEQYLQQLQTSLQNDEGKEEIIQDVETRISELFKSYLGISREVVNEDDVEQMKAVMGTPQQFMGEDDPAEETASKPNAKSTSSAPFSGNKKLYRDYDNKILGGVMAGLANYLGWEVTWLRIGYVLIFIFPVLEFLFLGSLSGIAFIGYFILWVLVPKAETTTEKLQMYGKPVNLDSIKKNIHIDKAEFDETLNNASSIAKKTANSAGSILESIFSVIFKILKTFIGVVLLIVGISLIVGMLTALFSLLFNQNIFQFGDIIFEEEWHYYAGSILAGIGLISLGTAFVYIALRFLFSGSRVKHTGLVLITTFSLFILSLIGFLVLFFTTSLNFKDSIEKPVKDMVNVTSDTLSLSYSDTHNKIYKYNSKNDFNLYGYTKNLDSLVIPIHNNLIVRKSKDSTIYLEKIYKSRGFNESDAQQNVEMIQYNYEVKDNQISLDPYFILPKGKKYRVQQVQLILYVPENTVIKLLGDMDVDNNYVRYYNDDNETTVLKMNENDLDCLNCKSDNDDDVESVKEAQKQLQEAQQKLDEVQENLNNNKTIKDLDLKIKINNDSIIIKSDTI